MLAKIAHFDEIGVEMAILTLIWTRSWQMGQLQTEIDAQSGWDLDSRLPGYGRCSAWIQILPSPISLVARNAV